MVTRDQRCKSGINASGKGQRQVSGEEAKDKDRAQAIRVIYSICSILASDMPTHRVDINRKGMSYTVDGHLRSTSDAP